MYKHTPEKEQDFSMSRRKAMPADVAEKVISRAGNRCEAAVSEAGCNGRCEHLHHRQFRSRGGAHTTENLIGVCNLCHLWIHDNSGIGAKARGLAVSRYANPLVIPVVRRTQLVQLDQFGGYSVVKQKA